MIYTLKNEGRTDISFLEIVSAPGGAVMLHEVKHMEALMSRGLPSYSSLYEKKIRPGETVTLKICYHRERISGSLFSALLSLYIIDSNKRCQTQPLFAPKDKLYDSRSVSKEGICEKTGRMTG